MKNRLSLFSFFDDCLNWAVLLPSRLKVPGNFTINHPSAMSLKKKKRQEVADQRDSKKFFTYVAIAVGAIMLLLYLIYRSM